MTPDAYIRNDEIVAENCRHCGATWSRCLEGWPASDRHPEGVCCIQCHLTDTHNAEAARRREAERRKAAADVPSGAALDRARELISKHAPMMLNPRFRESLAADIAKLIDAADAAQPTVTEVKPREQYLPDAKSRLESIDRVRPRHADAAVSLLRQRPVMDLVASALAEIEWFAWRCDGQRVHVNSQQRRITELERAQELRAASVRDANTQKRRLVQQLEEERRLRLEDVRNAEERVRHWEQIAEQRLREAESARQSKLTTATTDALLEELRQRLNT